MATLLCSSKIAEVLSSTPDLLLGLDAGQVDKNKRATIRDAKKFPELAKMHIPRTPWQWVKGSTGEKGARALFAAKN